MDVKTRVTVEDGLWQAAWDHVSGRHRVPVDLDTIAGRDALNSLLRPLGEPLATFAYWGELRVQRKREAMSSVLSPPPYPADNLPLCLLPPSGDAPLSADHQLFTMIQHNALRGTMANLALLSQLAGCRFEGWDGLLVEDLPLPTDGVGPVALRRTRLQEAVVHEAWIDVIPYAAMRDNIIRFQDAIDVEDLCSDFLGGMYEGTSEIHDRGMVLWGEPWAEEGWEISEHFTKKWWFLMRGCLSFVVSSNRWRKARGDGPLIAQPELVSWLEAPVETVD